jgi:hypothetical protein
MTWLIVTYSTKKNIETFFVCEHEERQKKKHKFSFLKTIVSYITLFLKYLM